MKYRIDGDNLELVTLQIGGNETIYGETGSLTYMSGNVEMKTERKGGIMDGIKRSASGESYYLTKFETIGGEGIVSFGGKSPGRILPFDVQPGSEYIVQRNAYLCSEAGVDIDTHMQKKLGKIFFGGEGMFLQKLTGTGTAFIHVTGDLVEKELNPQELLKVSTSHVAAFEPSVKFDVERVGGIKSSLFGGEGFFMTTLQGPGKVWLRSLTLSDLGAALSKHISTDSSSSSSSSSSGKTGIKVGGFNISK